MSNKTKKIALFALSALLLTGCTELRARPSDYEDKLIDGTIQDEVVDNIVSVVVDSLDDQNLTKSEVLDRVKVALAQSIIGTWAEISDAYVAGKDSQEFAKLVESHKYYTDNIDASLSPAETKDYQFWRLEQLAKDIIKRCKETLYYQIAGGSYSVDNKFDEEKFANSLRSELYEVTDPTTDAYPTIWYKDIILLPQLLPENVGDYALHLDYYDDYIDRELVPTILKKIITEQYLYDENYSSLGRAYARKVNYVAITASTEYPLAADYLIKEFISENILGASATKETANLEILANAWRGYTDDYIGNEADLIINSGGFIEVPTIPGRDTYYKGTKYGDICAKLDLIKSDPVATDISVENDFSGNNTYPVSHGFELKTNEMRLVDYTVDGWYIKNGGLTSLPDSIRSRLFNIGVANGVDTVTDEKDPSIPEEEKITSKYVRNINGYYYLTPAQSESGDDSNFLLYDSGSSTYYIVQIEEAVSSRKLSRDSSDNYTHIKGDHGQFMETVAREVAHNMGSGDTYDNQAILYYFEAMKLQYHDQQIYDYFKETFPELWEE